MFNLWTDFVLADARQKQVALKEIMTLKTVLVVCSGNIHRSPIAEFCLNKSLEEKGLDKKIIAVSRGMQGTSFPTGKNLRDYPLEWSLSNPVLEELGIDISNHHATPIEPSIVERASLILVMDHKILEQLIVRFPEHRNRMHPFRELSMWNSNKDVPDCFGSREYRTHKAVIKLISNISRRRIETLLEWVLTLETAYRKGG